MSTPYTLMKDLISCFNACKVPIEEDADELDHHKPEAPSIGDDRNRKVEDTAKIRTTAEKGGGEESPASWQSCESEEDDYIVFYFKDDDAGGDVIEERGLQSSSSERKHDVSIRRKKKNEKVNESLELRDSLDDSSDSSASSFAFPSIQREWTVRSLPKDFSLLPFNAHVNK
ncbi:hypothetical protein L1987_44763 [Smallanthus sonchifolius]|uniref:Uncharacterized protein n=1 Tax=Smallanthus sonchifolius TaxID=185202 RepID=A0ACB9GQ63_9ASTR|nr:hypothetical protein L1987_44763 [Smallanthus sonchifolius]